MKKKIFKGIVIGASSIIVLLAATLAIHVYMVTPVKKVNSDARQRQLSRIDFKQEIDSVEAEKIRGFVASLDGVDATYFNVTDNVLVYTYTVGTQNSTNVYNKLMQYGNYKAEKYIVTAQDAHGGCPVSAEKKSFTGTVSAYMASLFN